MNWGTGRIILTVAVVALLAATAFAQTSVQAPRRGGRLIVGLAQDIPGLDPHPSTSTITYIVQSLVFQSLVDFDRNLNIRPVLAEAWQVSPNGREWTFRLRRGVKFHNGREFTAQDVKFTFERILDPKTAARGRGALTMIQRIETVDSHTARFHLSAQSGAFLSRIAQTFQAIIPREAVGTTFNPIGTGPYQLVEWKTNDRIVLRRFPGYWEAGIPYLDELVLRPIPDGTVRLTALQTGEVGLIQTVPLERLAEIFRNPSREYVVRQVRGGGGFGLYILNTRKPPFNDVRVRRAAAFAVDKQEVVLGAYRGFGRPINQLMPPNSAWFFPRVKDRKPDVEQARRLLAEAGHARGFRIVHTVGQVGNLVPAAQVFQAQLRRIGIDMDLEVLDWAAYIKRQRAVDFVSTNTGFFPKGDPDDAYFRYFHSRGGANELSGGYSNPTVDRLLEDAEAAIDSKRRAELYEKLVEIIQDEVPVIITVMGDAATGWRTTVKGYEPHIIGIFAYPGGGLTHTWIER